MAKQIPKKAKRDLKNLVSAIHTSDPRKLLDSMDAQDLSKSDNLAKLASLMGNEKAAAEIRRTEMALKLLRESDGR
jgi:hypothetical protein